jgi:hypothetical protein
MVLPHATLPIILKTCPAGRVVRENTLVTPDPKIPHFPTPNEKWYTSG